MAMLSDSYLTQNSTQPITVCSMPEQAHKEPRAPEISVTNTSPKYLHDDVKKNRTIKRAKRRASMVPKSTSGDRQHFRLKQGTLVPKVVPKGTLEPIHKSQSGKRDRDARKAMYDAWEEGIGSLPNGKRIRSLHTYAIEYYATIEKQIEPSTKKI